MKKLFITFLAASLIILSGCKKFLDVNTNPNAPQSVEANLYLAPMLHWMVTSPIYEARFVGRYTQNWTLISTNSSWDRQGYDPASDNGGQQWRDVYWSLGQNLIDMTTKAENEKRYDLLGVAQILKAWGWLALTDTHGEIIIKQAIDPTRTTFDYDSQEFAYQEILRLLNLAITNLSRTDGAVDAAYLGKTDVLYKGNRALWTKFAQGMKAIALNHFSNKASYNKDAVIAAVDASFSSNADEALLGYTGSANDDINFMAAARDNITSYRQTKFILELMNGTQFGGVVDPRMSRMLAPAPDGVYRGLEPTFGVGALAAAQQPLNFWGYTTLALANASTSTPSRYIFSRKSKLPVMTYAQLQFIKAEAAYKKGDMPTAYAAYKNGISSHIDWVNARNLDDGQSPTQISALEKSAYLAAPTIVPATATGLTLSMIMCQKYIAQWGWGHNEQWMDMRRYHYLDKDPVTSNQVFLGFVTPVNIYPDNQTKLVYRIRPRYNSEYVWNRPGLDAIGGLALDYHTKEMWITQP
jgi:hypothetical protein